MVQADQPNPCTGLGALHWDHHTTRILYQTYEWLLSLAASIGISPSLSVPNTTARGLCEKEFRLRPPCAGA